MRRTNDRVDTMKSRKIDDGGDTRARVHGVLLVDKGSCDVPAGQTLTLEEWQAQQRAS